VIRGLRLSLRSLLLVLGGWAVLDVPSLSAPGLRAAFVGMFLAAVIAGSWAIGQRHREAANLAVILLAPYLVVGAYGAGREFWLLLLYVVLLVLFALLHQLYSFASTLPRALEAEGSEGAVTRAVLRVVGVSGLAFGASLAFTNVAAVTFAGTNDILSGMVFALGLLAVILLLATVGRRRRRKGHDGGVAGGVAAEGDEDASAPWTARQ